MTMQVISRFLVLSLVLTGLSQLRANGHEITRNQALAVAAKVVKQSFPTDRYPLTPSISISTALKTNEPFYICRVGETGFVLIAKNDHCPPVLGFSWESSFPTPGSDVPPLMQTVIDNIRNQCDDYASRDSVNSTIVGSWQSYSGKKTGLSNGSLVVAPLLKTTWNCDSTYFELFPKSFQAGGSVPIAMAQVFRYYGQPRSGTGSLCYILNGYGELCAHFDQTTFNFDQMSNNAGNPAVDTLVYCMAVACTMESDGAFFLSYVNTLPVYFGYSKDMRMVEGWNYDIGEVVRHQLSLRRPVPADWIGHSFVIDGYFPDNLFHFNMGLGGAYDGFYLLDYPVVNVDANHTLLTCYTDYRPASLLPAASNLNAVAEGDSIRISWDANMSDSLRSLLVRFVVLRDGLIPVAQTTGSSVVVSPASIGGSTKLRVVTDFGAAGASEMSEPFLYISDGQVADIPSLQLRQVINLAIGSSYVTRQPLVGELELIRAIEINFSDQRGLEKLTKLRNLSIDGSRTTSLRDGDYLQNLTEVRFYNCLDFDHSIFGHTRSLYHLYGYDFLPFDLFEFRHNHDLGLLQFSSAGANPNMLMDLYGADKYFPKLADLYLHHMSGGAVGVYQECFVSKETFTDVYPRIHANLNLYLRTKPSSFAPCYPTPARNANVPAVSRISWQANFGDAEGVYYNVFLGNNRRTLELVSVFQSEKYFEGTFEPDTDYYWRVEAYHADSTYYSGIYHFSTWQDLPMPFIERFDDYYTNCPVADESPFWNKMDTTLKAMAVANRNIKFDGFYSLEMKPQSDAGLIINSPVDPVYYIEFRFLNQGGELAAELLQKSGSSDENIVNSRIEFLGNDIGLFTFEGSSFPFTFIPARWNRVDLSLNMTTGLASLSLNETVLKEWQWHVQIGGGANTNPFKGIRLVNNASAGGGSAFVDNLIIDLENPASVIPLLDPEIGMIYLAGSREVLFTGIQANDILDMALYDIRGRKLVLRQNPDNLLLPIGSSIVKGIYLVVVNRKEGLPFSRKIAVLD